MVGFFSFFFFLFGKWARVCAPWFIRCQLMAVRDDAEEFLKVFRNIIMKGGSLVNRGVSGTRPLAAVPAAATNGRKGDHCRANSAPTQGSSDTTCFV